VRRVLRRDVILGFEVTFIGREHVPFNSGLLQTVAAAFPNETIRFYAASGHLAELRVDAALTAHGNVELRESPVALHRAGDPKRLSAWRVYRRTLGNLDAALAEAPAGERCLIVLFSSTPAAIFAASTLARRHKRRLAGVQIVLHSNLGNIALDWISKVWPYNHIVRRLAASQTLVRAPAPVSFLVPELGIETELAKLLPRVAARTDALPHPVNPAEFAHDTVRPLAEPVCIGFLGRPIKSRGRDVFRKLAQTFHGRYGDRMDFRFVGYLKTAETRASDTRSMPRPEYIEGVADIHYVLLPLFQHRYALVASGALIDALTLRKPVIIAATAYARRLFAEFGALGYLCENEKDFEAALDSVMTLDGARYARQIEALGRARASRTPEALAPRYRDIVAKRFGFHPRGSTG
jgi:hypothetical protein